MKLHSDSFADGHAIPERCAMGTLTGLGGNRNPQLSWSDLPEGTQSLLLWCVDPDVPTVAEMVGKAGVEIPVEQPRCEFTHWLLADIPVAVSQTAEGAWSDGVTPRGKAANPAAGADWPAPPHPARVGLNDYTGWFAGDAAMGGDWHGYDGPYPPANDLRLHRYFFRLFALDVAHLDLPERFTAADALTAMHGHVLDEARLCGTYSLHPLHRT